MCDWVQRGGHIFRAAFFGVVAARLLQAQYGPETCKAGFVWREATGPNDHVCVLPATRAQAAQDNSQAAARRQGSGPYGPDTCVPGYVWREAVGPQDHVCVTSATRTQAAEDNAAAASRFLNPPVLWDVLTQHNDASRSGAQLHETTLNPTNVRASTFGRLYERNVTVKSLRSRCMKVINGFRESGCGTSCISRRGKTGFTPSTRITLIRIQTVD